LRDFIIGILPDSQVQQAPDGRYSLCADNGLDGLQQTRTDALPPHTFTDTHTAQDENVVRVADTDSSTEHALVLCHD
jgi:hypothetical protein